MKTSEKTLYFLALLYTFCVYGPMAMMSIGAGVVFCGWLVIRYGHLRADLLKFRESPLFIPTFVFAAACIWSLVWAKLTNLTFMGVRPTISWVGDTRKAWHLFFPLILAPIFSELSHARLRRVGKLWLLLGVASAILGIIQYYVPLYHPMRLPHLDYDTYKKGDSFFDFLRGSYHATGMTGFHLSYASIIGFPASLALAVVAVLYRREKVSKRTVLGFAGATLFFIANLCTYSKIAWVVMPLTVLLISIIGFRGWPRYILMILVVAFGIVWGSSDEVKLRFQGTDTIKERMQIWNANLEMIKAHPLFGVGWHRNSELSHVYYEKQGIKGFESHAHNNLLDQFATTGIFGLLSFLWWSFIAIWMCLNIYKVNHDLLWRSVGLGFIGGWFCLHLNGMTQANFWDAKVLHQISWVTAMSMEVYRRSKIRKLEKQIRVAE